MGNINAANFGNFGNFGGNDADGGPNIASLFGGNAGANGAKNAQKKAKYWLNVGYVQKTVDEETGEEDSYFVSIRFGIGLDTQEDFDLTGSARMRKLRKKQNDLRKLLVNAAKDLEPGESKIISHDPVTNFALELRRVQEASDASDIEDDDECPIRLVG